MFVQAMSSNTDTAPNIRRVVQRLLVGPHAAELAGEAQLLALAQAAVPPGQGWAWNQAIMELGALVCTARVRHCARCPVRAQCATFAADGPPRAAGRV